MNIKKIDEIIVAGNRGRGKPNKKWIKIIEEDMRACKVNENMVREE